MDVGGCKGYVNRCVRVLRVAEPEIAVLVPSTHPDGVVGCAEEGVFAADCELLYGRESVADELRRSYVVAAGGGVRRSTRPAN